MIKRVGITMRVDNAIGYNEPRDCLSQDWWVYLLKNFPQTQWLVLPNLKDRVCEYSDSMGVDAFLLSGGNDLGNSIERDETETAILKKAVQQKLPVFGVCRGLQMLNQFFKGTLISDLTSLCGTPDAHVRKNHLVAIEDRNFSALLKNQELVVNSYHRHAVTNLTLSPDLRAFAFSEEGLVEGIYHPNMPIIATQWHPEREDPACTADLILMNTWLKQEGI